MKDKGKVIKTCISVLTAVALLVGVAVVVSASSPYDKAVKRGYTGTEMQMLCSLAAETGDTDGKKYVGTSSYQEAVLYGFNGSASEWAGLFISNKSIDENMSVYENDGRNISLNKWLSKISSANLKKTVLRDASGEKSVYAYACDYGFDGSAEEWIASLIGKCETGNKLSSPLMISASAADLSNSSSASVSASQRSRGGFRGTLQRWFKNLLGIEDGVDGANGSNGLSAYEIAVKNGYNGTEIEWLRSLAGPNGKSAYEIACISCRSPGNTRCWWREWQISL